MKYDFKHMCTFSLMAGALILGAPAFAQETQETTTGSATTTRTVTTVTQTVRSTAETEAAEQAQDLVSESSPLANSIKATLQEMTEAAEQEAEASRSTETTSSTQKKTVTTVTTVTQTQKDAVAELSGDEAEDAGLPESTVADSTESESETTVTSDSSKKTTVTTVTTVTTNQAASEQAASEQDAASTEEGLSASDGAASASGTASTTGTSTTGTTTTSTTTAAGGTAAAGTAGTQEGTDATGAKTVTTVTTVTQNQSTQGSSQGEGAPRNPQEPPARTGSPSSRPDLPPAGRHRGDAFCSAHDGDAGSRGCCCCARPPFPGDFHPEDTPARPGSCPNPQDSDLQPPAADGNPSRQSAQVTTTTTTTVRSGQPKAPRAWTISVNTIFFDPDAATFKTLSPTQIKSNNEILDSVASQIKTVGGKVSVEIQGHANNVSNTEREDREELMPLSLARAQAIRQQLIDRGIPASSLSAVGKGGSEPIAAWEDHDNWWKNRRVEFVVSVEE